MRCLAAVMPGCHLTSLVLHAAQDAWLNCKEIIMDWERASWELMTEVEKMREADVEALRREVERLKEVVRLLKDQIERRPE